MTFVDWIRQLAVDLGRPGAVDASDGVLELEFTGGVRCCLERSSDGRELFLSSALAPLPTTDAEELLERLLIANAPELSAGPVFAIEPHRNEIVLQQSFAPQASADYDAFVVAVGQFIEEARQWKECLVAGRPFDLNGGSPVESVEAAGASAGYMRV